jgi:hypothetical protein
VARQVWQYRRTPEAYGSFMGSAQRLPDGGTMIGWGGVGNAARLTEIHADGTRALEIAFARSTIWTYRAFRFPWKTTRFRAEPATLDFGAVTAGTTPVLPVVLSNPGPAPITLTSFEVTGGSGFFVLDLPPVTLAVGASAEVRIAFHPLSAGGYAAKLTVAAVTATERIAQQVKLLGAATTAPGAWRPDSLEGAQARGGPAGRGPPPPRAGGWSWRSAPATRRAARPRSSTPCRIPGRP